MILWPDIAGIREAKRNIARKLATEGYAVLVVNPYYRDVAGEQFADFAAFIAGGGFGKVGPWRAKLTAEAVMRDATAIVGWLDRQPGVDTSRGIGTQGYCMGGPFTVWSAAACRAGSSCGELPRRRAGAGGQPDEPPRAHRQDRGKLPLRHRPRR